MQGFVSGDDSQNGSTGSVGEKKDGANDAPPGSS